MSTFEWRPEDDALVDLLMRTGMRKNTARALAHLKRSGESTSLDIEAATSLRQPEVSIAMQDLRSRGWVEKRDMKRKGKGRPIHAYSLALTFSEIIDVIEAEEQERVEEILGNIATLRNLSG